MNMYGLIMIEEPCGLEVVHIRKEGRRSMNQNEGSYTLSHTYDRFLAKSHHYHGKNRKKNC